MVSSFKIDAGRSKSITRGRWIDGTGRVNENMRLSHEIRCGFVDGKTDHVFRFSLRSDAERCFDALAFVFDDVEGRAIVSDLDMSHPVPVAFPGEWDWSGYRPRMIARQCDKHDLQCIDSGCSGWQ